MPPTDPSGIDPQDILKDFLESRKDAPYVKSLTEILELVRRSRQQKSKVPEKSPSESKKKPESDCPEDVEDCSDVVSPCCKVPVTTIFGTLPLKVSCKQCGKEYLLGVLMRDFLRKPKTTA